MRKNISPDAAPEANDFSTPVRPGQTLVLYGAGLGAVEGNEAAGTVPSASSGTGVEVWLGLRRARVISAGRSECCAGMDQIVIETPAGIEGCTVPVDVRLAPGELASYSHVAVASAGACSDPDGLSEQLRCQVSANGGGRLGAITVGQIGWALDGVSANFTRVGSGFVTPSGTCGYPPFRDPPATGVTYYWNAGPALQLEGPSGEQAIPQDLVRRLGAGKLCNPQRRRRPRCGCVSHPGSPAHTSSQSRDCGHLSAVVSMDRTNRCDYRAEG